VQLCSITYNPDMQPTDPKKLLSELLELAKEFKIVDTIETLKQPYFPTVLLAILRRDYPVLHTMNLLKDDEMSGDSIIDLSRRLFEDMISVEFMILKGKEKYAQKFIEFSTVERWNDLQYLKKIGAEQDKNMEEEIERDFLLVKDKFMFKDEVARSWAKMQVDKMLELFVKEGKIDNVMLANLSQGYIVGNRKNHLSSYDTQIFADKDRREKEINNAGNVGIGIALVCYIRLLALYAEEKNDKDLEKKLTKYISLMQ
jgi:hypothetical protein